MLKELSLADLFLEKLCGDQSSVLYTEEKLQHDPINTRQQGQSPNAEDKATNSKAWRVLP